MNLISDRARIAKLAEIDSKIIETERTEASFLFLASGDRHRYPTRLDASPAAVLAVTI